MNVDDYLSGNYDQTKFLDAIEFVTGNPIQLRGGGVCAQLSSNWLQLKLKDLSVGGKQSTADRLNVIKNPETLAKAIEENKSLVGDKPWIPYGLVVHGRSVLFPSIAQVAKTVTSNRQSGYLYQFTCPKYQDGKHAIAAYLSSGKILGVGQHVYVFDPDEGEYKVPKKDFGEWLSTFLNDKYKAGNENSTSLDELEVT